MAFPLIGIVGLALLSVVAGCRDNNDPSSPPPPPKPVPPEKKTAPALTSAPAPSVSAASKGQEATFREELKSSSPDPVKILQIRDLHGMIDGEDPNKVAPKILMAMGNYQLRILSLLEQRKPKHLFMEGSSTDKKGPAVQEIVQNKFRDFDKVKTLVLNGNPQKAQGMDLATWQTVLFYLGAAQVYSLRHPEVTLHRCASETENDEAYNFLLKGYLPYVEKHGENYDAPILGTTFRKMNEKREDWVTREIRNFLKSPEGKALKSDAELVIYFGAGHSFCDNFIRAGFNAQLTSAYWSVEHSGYQKLLMEVMPKACTP